MATFIGGKRTGAITFTIANTAYVGFGRSNSGSQTKDIYSFDPSGGADGKGVWTRIEFNDDFEEDDFPTRAFGLALVINSKAYIVGGEGRSDVWEYNPLVNGWIETASFPGGGRGFAGGFVVGNIGYLGTGSSSGNGGGTDDFWGFDPTIEINDDDDI